MALNMGIKLPNKYLDRKYLAELCDKVRQNDVSYDVLLSHQKHIIQNDAMGIVQYYTIQGSYFINKYLRNQVKYNTRNQLLDDLINPLSDICTTSPAFDKSYILYRFVNEDSYLSNLNIGDTFTEEGFMSTTRNPFYRADLYSFGFILIKIRVPANIQGIGLCLETLSHFPDEQEIIFPPMSKFKLISKDKKCVYYHTDEKFSSKVKTRYEFEWVGNVKNFKVPRKIYTGETKTVDFLNARYKDTYTLSERISYFINEYVNVMSQFISIVGNKQIVNIAERFDSTGAYKNFYAIKNVQNGFSIYALHNGYLLYFIELCEIDGKTMMHVNYYVKYNTLDKSNILNDMDLVKYISSIAYYFGIANVLIYAEYKSCSDNKKNKEPIQRQFGQRSFSNKIADKKENTNEDKSVYVGNYCYDFYNYLKNGNKRFSNIPSIELTPKFSYIDLDHLKNVSIEKIISKNDRDEIYQVYEKIYVQQNKNTDVASFFIWVIENKCYLIDALVSKFDRIYYMINPFKNDVYILEPITFLYNRKMIDSYTSVIQDDIFEPREVYLSQKNEYRTSRTDTSEEA